VSRTSAQEGARIARHMIADQVATALRAFYGSDALVEVGETNTGLQQLRLQLRDGPIFHLTLTKARNQ